MKTFLSVPCFSLLILAASCTATNPTAPNTTTNTSNSVTTTSGFLSSTIGTWTNSVINLSSPYVWRQDNSVIISQTGFTWRETSYSNGNLWFTNLLVVGSFYTNLSDGRDIMTVVSWLSGSGPLTIVPGSNYYSITLSNSGTSRTLKNSGSMSTLQVTSTNALGGSYSLYQQ